MHNRKDYEYFMGVSYRLRLEELQRRYFGLHKCLERPERRRGRGNTPSFYAKGSEAERVKLAGRA